MVHSLFTKIKKFLFVISATLAAHPSPASSSYQAFPAAVQLPPNNSLTSTACPPASCRSCHSCHIHPLCYQTDIPPASRLRSSVRLSRQWASHRSTFQNLFHRSWATSKHTVSTSYLTYYTEDTEQVSEVHSKTYSIGTQNLKTYLSMT